MKRACVIAVLWLLMVTSCHRDPQPSSMNPETTVDETIATGDVEPETPATCPKTPPFDLDSPERVLRVSAKCIEDGDYRTAEHVLYEGLVKFGNTPALDGAWNAALEANPMRHAEPRQLTPGVDLDQLKRLGGGSSLVYKFLKNKETIAAFKPFQKRYQSNYRAEIASYRLCPRMRCGFDVPVNLPVYFDFDDFSRLYSHHSANPKDEFKEIIPTRMKDGRYRVYGTSKEWIREFALFPIEIRDLWSSWLNGEAPRESLHCPATDIIPAIAKRHERGDEVAKELAPHLENLEIYDLARQLSNLIVFDFLINNWDRASGVSKLYGVNCQFAHGRLMSIDNGASFPITPSGKPEKMFLSVRRFSRLTYDAIASMEHDEMLSSLFPDPSPKELERFATFWNQRQRYLDAVANAVETQGEDATFFFE